MASYDGRPDRESRRHARRAPVYAKKARIARALVGTRFFSVVLLFHFVCRELVGRRLVDWLLRVLRGSDLIRDGRDFGRCWRLRGVSLLIRGHHVPGAVLGAAIRYGGASKHEKSDSKGKGAQHGVLLYA